MPAARRLVSKRPLRGPYTWRNPMPVSIRTSFPPVIDDERILLDHEIVFVEEIVSEDLVDTLLGDALEHFRSECAELERAIGNHRAFESAELEAIGGGHLR